MPRKSVLSALPDVAHETQRAHNFVDLAMILNLWMDQMSDLYDVMYDVMLVVLGLDGRNGDVGSLLLDG